MKKTLADLKRDAAACRIALEIVERFGDTGEAIPEKMRGIRRVVRVNTVGLFLLNSDGRESEMRFSAASLVDYDGETLTIYNPGKREPNAEEKAVLAEEKTLLESKQNSYDGGFWAKKAFYAKCACPWMAGWDEIRGKKYETFSGLVRDSAIKGDPILRYKVHNIA